MGAVGYTLRGRADIQKTVISSGESSQGQRIPKHKELLLILNVVDFLLVTHSICGAEPGDEKAW